MTVTPDTHPLLTPAEAAQFLGRSVAALAQLRYRGGGPPYIKAAGRIRYRRAAIDAWLLAAERSRT